MAGSIIARAVDSGTAAIAATRKFRPARSAIMAASRSHTPCRMRYCVQAAPWGPGWAIPFWASSVAENRSDREPRTLTERDLRRDLIAAETAELARLFNDGTISSQARRGLQRTLDLELARLTDAPP